MADTPPTFQSRSSRWLIPTIAASSILLILAAAIYLINPLGLFRNHYLPIGYYGNHNRALAIVEQMPGVEILKEWGHEDIMLEDSFIDIRYEGRDIHLSFSWESFSGSTIAIEDLFEGFPRRLRGESTPSKSGRRDSDYIIIHLVDEALNRAQS